MCGAMFTGICTGVLLLGSFAAFAQTPASPEDLLLAARHKIMDTVNRLPKYMCTMTINRHQYEFATGRRPRSCDDLAANKKIIRQDRRLSASDRLPIDVAISDIREMYSWSGANRFQDHDLGRIVNFGTTQTGDFSDFLRVIFGGGDRARFSYDGDVTISGRPASEYGLNVPLEKSNYDIKTEGAKVTTAYSGIFLVDSKTADLIHLVINTGILPPETGVCEVTQTLDYGRVRLNDADFLLPTEPLVHLTRPDGSESDNRTVYSACHEFRGESTLSFDDAPNAAGSTGPGEAVAPPATRVPPRLPFKLTLTQSIDTATAAAGDLIKAKLATNIVDESSKVLGARGRGCKRAHRQGPLSIFDGIAILDPFDQAGIRH